MSGSLARPDWGADIKNLDRRLGILERRTTPIPQARAPVAGTNNGLLIVTLSGEDDDYGATIAVKELVPVLSFQRHDAAPELRAAATLALGPVNVPADGTAAAFTVVTNSITAEGDWDAYYTLMVANADCTQRIVASTGAGGVTLAGADPVPIPAPGDWGVTVVGADLNLTTGDDPDTVVVESNNNPNIVWLVLAVSYEWPRAF